MFAMAESITEALFISHVRSFYLTTYNYDRHVASSDATFHLRNALIAFLQAITHARQRSHGKYFTALIFSLSSLFSFPLG